MSIVYIDKIPAGERTAFTAKLQQISQELGVQPSWLMQVFRAETGGTFSPSIQNPTTRATGLIQFMPKTAQGLGTTVDALKVMTRTQQLHWVKMYFLPYRNKMKSYYDVYAVTFFPAMIGKPDDWVFQTTQTRAETIAKQNPAVNINKDNKITVAEFKKYVEKTVPTSYWEQMFGKVQSGVNTLIGDPQKKKVALIIGATLLAVVIFVMSSKKRK